MRDYMEECRVIPANKPTVRNLRSVADRFMKDQLRPEDSNSQVQPAEPSYRIRN